VWGGELSLPADGCNLSIEWKAFQDNLVRCGKWKLVSCWWKQKTVYCIQKLKKPCWDRILLLSPDGDIGYNIYRRWWWFGRSRLDSGYNLCVHTCGSAMSEGHSWGPTYWLCCHMVYPVMGFTITLFYALWIWSTMWCPRIGLLAASVSMVAWLSTPGEMLPISSSLLTSPSASSSPTHSPLKLPPSTLVAMSLATQQYPSWPGYDGCPTENAQYIRSGTCKSVALITLIYHIMCSWNTWKKRSLLPPTIL